VQPAEHRRQDAQRHGEDGGRPSPRVTVQETHAAQKARQRRTEPGQRSERPASLAGGHRPFAGRGAAGADAGPCPAGGGDAADAGEAGGFAPKRRPPPVRSRVPPGTRSPMRARP